MGEEERRRNEGAGEETEGAARPLCVGQRELIGQGDKVEGRQRAARFGEKEHTKGNGCDGYV